MSDQVSAEIRSNVPSPFCGIASDDLRIEVSGLSVRVVENGDAVTTPAFELPVDALKPRVAGAEVSLEVACARAAELITRSHCPVFSGFGADVNDTRAALSLIDRCRGVFDQKRAEPSLRNLLVVADSGWMATTLGEVKNRVDVLVVFGTDIEDGFPRFFERFVWNRETLFGQDPATREVIYIGREPSGRAAHAPDGRAPWVLPCPPESWPDVAAALAALARGARLQATEVGGLAIGDLQKVVDRLKNASYGVVAWAAGQLDFPHADLTVQQLCQLVVVLNDTTRGGVLPLGGQNGDKTAAQVCAWQTGYPTRVSFARGYPEFDPFLFGTDRLLASGEADLLVWVASLSTLPPPVTDVPTIVIARSGMRCEREPEIFIPVGTPGIDHVGHTYRCDSVVALPLYKLRESGLPSAQTVLQGIENALDAL